jgi:hypothetical protein
MINNTRQKAQEFGLINSVSEKYFSFRYSFFLFLAFDQFCVLDKRCDIWGSHDNEYEDYDLLGRAAV